MVNRINRYSDYMSQLPNVRSFLEHEGEIVYRLVIGGTTVYLANNPIGIASEESLRLAYVIYSQAKFCFYITRG